MRGRVGVEIRQIALFTTVIKGNFFLFEGGKVSIQEHLVQFRLGNMFGSNSDNPRSHCIADAATLSSRFKRHHVGIEIQFGRGDRATVKVDALGDRDINGISS